MHVNPDQVFEHPRAGYPFNLVNEDGPVARALDEPVLCRMQGLRPEHVMKSWRLTGDNEAVARGGLTFVGETRTGKTITRHYDRKVWWRVLRFLVFKPKELKIKYVN